MVARLLVAVLMFISLTGVTAGAAEVIRVDPNTPEALQAREQPANIWTADPRLAQKVTYETHRKTVLGVLNDLSKMTGVTLHAGYNNLDWQVRDRNMLISAQDLSLGELMQSVARVMKFKWSRSQEEPYTYRLYMDRRTLLEEEGQAYRAGQRFLALQKKKRENLIKTLDKLAKMSAPEIEALKDNSPYSYTIARAGLAGPLSTLFREVPELRQAFMNSDRFSDKMSGYSPEAQKAAVETVRALHTMWRNPDPLPDDLDQSVISIKLTSGVTGDVSSPLRHLLLGILSVGCGDPRVGSSLEIVDPDSSYGKAEGREMAYIMDGGSPEAASAMFSVDKNEMEQLAEQDYGEVPVKHGEDLALAKEIELPEAKLDQKGSDTRKYKTPWDLMLAAAKASGYSMVSDYLGTEFQVTFPEEIRFTMPAKTQLSSALEQIQGSNFNWWRNGNVLEFRDRYWFGKRSLQIPEEYVGKWRDRYEAGTLGIADVVEMSGMLTDFATYAVNICGDEVLDDGAVERALMSQKGYDASFLLCLDSKQRAALESNKPLPVSKLKPEQLDVLKKRVVLDESEDDTKDVLSMQIDKGSDVNHYELILWRADGLHIPGIDAWVPVRKKPDNVTSSETNPPQ